MSWLAERGITAHAGLHAIYLPPQEKLEALLPEVVAFYPKHAGFKVLKDFRSPERARYVGRRDRFVGRARLLGGPADRLAAANYLHWLGLAPRAYDACGWRNGEAAYTAFVVEHVGGRTPLPEEHHAFIERLRDLVAKGPLAILHPDWQSSRDFRGPDSNGNLLWLDPPGCPRYVDFQNFAFVRRPSRPAALLDSDASRTAAERSNAVRAALRSRGIDLRRRLVLDLGGESVPLRISEALAAGAAWVVAWKDPRRVREIEELLFTLGVSRFDLRSREADLSLEAAVPERLRAMLADSIVFVDQETPPALLEATDRFHHRALVIVPNETISRQGGANGEDVVDIASREEGP